MSWDAYLRTPDGETTDASWNYTHNTNRMLAAALEAVNGTPPRQDASAFDRIVRSSWMDALDGATFADGQKLLRSLVAELVTHPDRYEAMNPDNGWGSRASVAQVLLDMAEHQPDEPADTLRWSIQ